MDPLKPYREYVTPFQCDVSRGTMAAFLDNVFGFIGVLVLAHLAYLLRDGSLTVVQFWPVSGFAVGLVLLRGACILPGLAAGAFVAPLLQGQAPLVCAGFMLAGVTEWLIYSYIFWRFLRKTSLTRLLTLPLVLIGVAAISVVSAALIGACTLTLAFDLPIESFRSLVIDWWHGDFIGIIIVAPLVMAFKWTRLSLRQVLQIVVLCGALLIFGFLIYQLPSSIFVLCLYALLIVLAAKWFPRAGPYWLNAAACVILVALTYRGLGPFLYDDGSYKHIWLGFYFIAIGVTALHVVHFPLKQDRITLIPLTALVSGILFSAGVYAYLTDVNRVADQLRLKELVSDAEKSIRNRLEIYINALRGGSSLYQVSPDLDHKDWVKFADSLDMTTRYPGINGIGVIDAVADDELEAFVSDIRSEGLNDFAIKVVPNVEAPPKDEFGIGHYIIKYIEPLEFNYQALGLNVASETNRQRAAMMARDSGNAQITGRIILVQDGKKRPGFLLLVPSYKAGMPLTTVEERQAAFVRWVYAPFITELLFEGVMDSKSGLLEFTVFDSDEISPETFAYSSLLDNPEEKMKFVFTSTLNLGGQDFTVGWNKGERLKATSSGAPMMAGIGFGAVSVLLTGLLISLINANQATGMLVDERTRELISLNDRLEEENADRKIAESEALNANQAKSEFLAVMSHEIRTPLNSVIGFSDIMKRSRLDSEQREWVDSILSSANQLLGLINDILDFSKIEANRLTIDKSRSNPLEVVRDVIRLISPLANEKKNYIKLNVGNHIPEECVFDAFRLRQILTNLIGNANKFADAGDVSVWIDFDAQTGALIFAVEDTGIGIPKDKQASLFQPFTQGDGTTTRRFGGTGLGLVLCKRLVEMMDGRIKLSSQENVGTRVEFSLPVEVTEEFQSKADLMEEVHEPSLGGAVNRTVLVVEDVPLNQRLARVFLENLDCDVDIANNGEDALAMVDKKSYDYILMDYQMPGMNGIETTKKIRELEGRRRGDQSAQRAQIIAMTANVSGEFRETCMQAGMVGFLAKPFTLEDVRAAIAKVEGA